MNEFWQVVHAVLGLWFVPPALILASTLWMALDSARLGVTFEARNRLGRRGPLAWFLAGLTLGPAALTYYLLRRRQHLAHRRAAQLGLKASSLNRTQR